MRNNRFRNFQINYYLTSFRWIAVEDWEFEDNFFSRNINFNIQTDERNSFVTNSEETKFYAKFEGKIGIPENLLVVPIRYQACLKTGKFELNEDSDYSINLMTVYFVPTSEQQLDTENFTDFVSLTTKEKNDYEFKCHVEISVAIENLENITGCVGTSSILAPVGQLLDTQDFSDFKFTVSGEEFNVHRSILSLASPYFATLFKSDFKENEERVLVNNENPVLFKLLLEFVYKGKFPDNFSDVAMDLYVMADLYQMEILKIYCLNHVKALTMNKENALKIYKFASEHQQTGLFELAWMFISR